MNAAFTKASEKVSVTGKLSPDLVKLFVDVKRLKEEQVSAQEILDLLKDSHKAPDMIERAVLEDIAVTLNRGEEVSERRISKGRAPETGADGKLLLLVRKFTGHGEVKIDERGFAHYSQLSLFDNLVPGQLVGRVYPPKNGVDGLSGLGEVIPAKAGQPLKQKKPRLSTDIE